MKMKHTARLILAIALLLPGMALAWCDNCGSGRCCTCSGEPQCLGSHTSCEEACDPSSADIICGPKMILNSAGRCMPSGSVDCGDNRFCKAGDQCAPGGCIPAGTIPCGQGQHCDAGMKCGSGNHCLKSGDVDCGGGRHCSAGYRCGPGSSCITL